MHRKWGQEKQGQINSKIIAFAACNVRATLAYYLNQVREQRVTRLVAPAYVLVA